MTKYEVRHHECSCYRIWNTETNEIFGGYDAMGGTVWYESDGEYEGWLLDKDEAQAILADLEAADADDDQPKKITLKQYLVKTSIDDEPINRIMTANEIVDLYEQDQLSGVYGEIKVWDITKDEPVRMDLLQMVEPVIAQRRWEEQEYRDYCENERY